MFLLKEDNTKVEGTHSWCEDEGVMKKMKEVESHVIIMGLARNNVNFELKYEKNIMQNKMLYKFCSCYKIRSHTSVIRQFRLYCLNGALLHKTYLNEHILKIL